MNITIFYSWQSTTSTKYNRNFIQNCIEKAIKRLEKLADFRGVYFSIQDGVRGVPGTPPVAATIMDERIPKCDIFIADISVVNALPKVGWLGSIARKLTKVSTKPLQNVNVFFEYGAAQQALGYEKIICILNTAYGSPNDNPDNIPFDVRHSKFPIEYKYSEQDAGEREVAQKKLVDDLFSALKATATFALQSMKSKYSPLLTWPDWEQRINPADAFYRNERITAVESTIKQAVNESSNSIRLLGLSGLGKTRILLELFRPQSDAASTLLSSRVLYLNCNNHPDFDYESLFQKLVRDGADQIVVLDNCPAEIHRSLTPVVHNSRNKLFLLTTSSNPEENHQQIRDVDYLLVAKNELAEVVDELLEKELTALGPDRIAIIKQFAQGIPLMAVLLVESLKKGETLVGKLDDKSLLDNLLGEKGKDKRWRIILRSYALFSYVGVEEELYSQVKFIALDAAITALDGRPEVILQEFHEVQKYYQQREIFERKGRTVGMRPFPLAMYLAQEWLDACPPPRMGQVLSAIDGLTEPDRRSLMDGWADQMKYLGVDERAVTIVEKLVALGGPFDNAEVLNSELGSRLFRSLAEVNPVAVSAYLVRQLAGMTQAQLLAIEKGRRNLVWVLEKLCFDERTFAESSRLLYALAAAENETWANNATGQLLQLFKILLAGTEANLNERWRLLEWGMAQQQEFYHELALKAMRVGLSFGHFTRTNGAEVQGTKTLQDHRPTRAEIADYWRHIIDRLAVFVESASPYAHMAADILLNSMRGLARAGQLLLLVPTLRQLVAHEYLERFATEKAVRFTLRFEKNNLTPEERTNLDELLAELTTTKGDFLTRYTDLQNSAILLDERYSGEKHRQLMEEMTEEFIGEALEWETLLPLLYQQRQPYSYYFGKRLYQLIESNTSEVERFIELSAKLLSEANPATRDLSLLAGFVEATPDQVKTGFYERLLRDTNLQCQLFYYVASDPEGYHHLGLLHQLIAEGNCQVQEFSTLKYGGLLEKLTDEQLLEFGEQLLAYGEASCHVVLDLYFTLAFNDVRLRELLLPMLEQCVRSLGVANVLNDKQDRYRGSQTILWLLDGARQEFAVLVNKSIIASITWDNYYHLDNDVQQVYELLLKNHFTAVWPELSAALLAQDEQYFTFYGLKHILGSGIGSVSRTIGYYLSAILRQYSLGVVPISHWHPPGLQNSHPFLPNRRRLLLRMAICINPSRLQIPSLKYRHYRLGTLLPGDCWMISGTCRKY
ncbi:hypothetical protein [Hymenobacter volaticus]|uniref:Uncharacterized protein n=1 Tax=Hymenobacter volaticus TaxID=2932254 RepID=A0ABY4G487_9BACT|nr:hypothetical protein [Hymenobacter volaticus]UOQ65712.1 hypothetical protein MUN86_19605 [Hymenobacter volaticus]